MVPGMLPSTGPATLQSVCTAADFRAVHVIDSGQEMLTVSLLVALRHRQRSGPHRLDSKALCTGRKPTPASSDPVTISEHSKTPDDILRYIY